MSVDDVEEYEAELELQLYREYRDVVKLFRYVVETERRFYLANRVSVKQESQAGEVYFDVTMEDTWVWDVYRPRRFATKVRVMTFRDVNVEQLDHSELEVPDSLDR